MRTVRLAPGAIADIRRILQRSKAEFGAGAGARYKGLLDQAHRIWEKTRVASVSGLSLTSAPGTSFTTSSSASRE